MASHYQPIERYGLIGNLRTAALVGCHGSIDWLCLPHFDSPSVFAAILDDQQGGRFQIAPAGDDFRHKQFYWPDTNILVSRFLHTDGRRARSRTSCRWAARRRPGELDPPGARRPRPADVPRGVPAGVRLCPRTPPAPSCTNMASAFDGPRSEPGPGRPVQLQIDGDGVVADLTLDEGQSATFVLRQMRPDEEPDCCPGVDQAEALFRETVGYWQRWLAHCTYRGRWREIVQRSALALKLLTFEPTGAIVAAPTTQPARSDRRRAELGLSLYLDSRRLVHRVRPACGSASPRRRPVSRTGWRPAGGGLERLRDGPLQLMYAIDGRRRARRKRRSTTWRATAARARCGSAMPLTGNCRWIFTASSWMRFTCTTSTSRRSDTTAGSGCGS